MGFIMSLQQNKYGTSDIVASDQVQGVELTTMRTHPDTERNTDLVDTDYVKRKSMSAKKKLTILCSFFIVVVVGIGLAASGYIFRDKLKNAFSFGDSPAKAPEKLPTISPQGVVELPDCYQSPFDSNSYCGCGPQNEEKVFCDIGNLHALQGSPSVNDASTNLCRGLFGDDACSVNYLIASRIASANSTSGVPASIHYKNSQECLEGSDIHTDYCGSIVSTNPNAWNDPLCFTTDPNEGNVACKDTTIIPNTDPEPTCFLTPGSSFCTCSEEHYLSPQCIKYNIPFFQKNPRFINDNVGDTARVCEGFHGRATCLESVPEFIGYFSHEGLTNYYTFTYECQRSSNLSTEIGYNLCSGDEQLLNPDLYNYPCFSNLFKDYYENTVPVDACGSYVFPSVIPDPDPRSFCGCNDFNAQYPVCVNRSLAFFTPTNVVLHYPLSNGTENHAHLSYQDRAFFRCEELNGCSPCAQRPAFATENRLMINGILDPINPCTDDRICEYEYRFADECQQSLLGPDPESERCNSILENNDPLLNTAAFDSCFILKHPNATLVDSGICGNPDDYYRYEYVY